MHRERVRFEVSTCCTKQGEVLECHVLESSTGRLTSVDDSMF
jgi:hypothetical protein